MQPRPACPDGCCTSAPERQSSPSSLTRLIGRERELAELETVSRSKRLVTLTGPGGTGKTRLAAEHARRLEALGAQAVWVDLACLADPQRVPQQIASALSLRQITDRPPLEVVISSLRDSAMLIVLDNCEHLIDTCSSVAATLLASCPEVRILATSREPLGVGGEQVWPVQPLGLPAAGDWMSVAAAEAVQLFADRARAANPSFLLDAENAGAVAEICRALDGMPLAIELAAARSRLMTPAQIAARLEDQLALLSGGARSTVARHRTLRAAIDWSFDLLSPAEQSLLTRLSLFRGSFSLDAAEAVCSDDTIARAEILDLLAGLVDKSLVVSFTHHSGIRYFLLKTIAQYAAEKIDAAGRQTLRRRHASAFVELAREALPDLLDASLSRIDSLDADHANVCAALEWSVEHDPDGAAVPLAGAWRWYWYYRISWTEGLMWMRRVLDRATPSQSAEYAAVLSGAGSFASYVGDLSQSRDYLARGVDLWRASGDKHQLALALAALAHVLGNANEIDEATARAEEAVAVARRTGSSYCVVYCLANAAAFVAQRRGDLEAADRLLQEAQDRSAELKHPLGLPLAINARALLALRRNDPQAAAGFASEGLRLVRESGELWFAARSLRVLAVTARSVPTRAAKLVGAADGMLRKIGAGLLLYEKGEHDCLMNELSDALPAEDLESLMEEGRRLSFEEALEFALSGKAWAAPREQSEHDVLQIADLGPLQISIGGKPLAEVRSSARARELLALLASQRVGRSREEVGAALWPDASPEQLKNSFHVTLHRLRKLIGSERIKLEAGRYLLDPALAHQVDSREFESAISAGLAQLRSSGDPASLERALSLYRGDYLHGEDTGEWSLPIRSQLRQLHLRSLLALGEAHENRGRFADAADTYAILLARDPFHEEACRRLMICRVRLGARSDSLLIYRRFEERLRDDLSAAPESETEALYRRILQNEAV
jgi:predicted ATPase/DNA-binding SARP family transcriptional activator